MMLLRQEVWAGSMEPEMIVINVRPSLLLSEHRPVAAVVRGRALFAHTTAMPGPRVSCLGWRRQLILSRLNPGAASI